MVRRLEGGQRRSDAEVGRVLEKLPAVHVVVLVVRKVGRPEAELLLGGVIEAAEQAAVELSRPLLPSFPFGDHPRVDPESLPIMFPGQGQECVGHLLLSQSQTRAYARRARFAGRECVVQQRRGTAPWKRSSNVTAKRGRPRKQAAGTNGDAGCIWPGKDGTRCRKQVQQGLALCCGHAKVLSLQPGRECVWPECSQAASFRSTCPYHEKRCRGLLDGGR
jgi:hypothetical protein